jgi:UDP-2,4-diacetamido-2,4,6-trideoxy-beta-L-altropyranose hydrolase
MTGDRKSLLVRADSSPEIGAGHVMRCLALSKAWQCSGGDVTFASAEMLPALKLRLRAEDIQVMQIDGEPGSDLDVEQTGDFVNSVEPEWMVVDGYRFRPAYYRHWRQRDLPCLAIDDDGRFEEYCADVVLNQNASANEAMYKQRQPYTKLLLGSSFALVRPEFTRVRPEREIPLVARKLLVTMGGSDPENVTMKVIQALAKIGCEGAEIRVVLGSGYRYARELRARASNLRAGVFLEENPPEMVPLMAWADLAISAAGGTCWELAYMGVPAVVIAISADQEGIARAVAARGAAHSLGCQADISAPQILAVVRELMNDSQRRGEMSRAGRKLVDGLGPQRVVDFLQNAV